MFRIVRECGKILSGGFGVAYKCPRNHNRTSNYLFIEETLFLHERGLIHVYFPGNDPIPPSLQYPSFQKKIQSWTVELDSVKETVILLDTQDLYTLMLHHLHFPLSVYVTYSHLRSQSYIVLRHFEQRLSMIRQLQRTHETSPRKRKSNIVYDPTDDTLLHLSHDTLRVPFRSASFHAPIPTILDPQQTTQNIAFHVYQPTCSYRKTDPGDPDFFVAIAYFHEPQSLSFDQIYTLTRDCQGIPLRLATVSDSGTVIMFGITDVGVPCIGQGIGEMD
jgi:hypothetical protein